MKSILELNEKEIEDLSKKTGISDFKIKFFIDGNLSILSNMQLNIIEMALNLPINSLHQKKIQY